MAVRAHSCKCIQQPLCKCVSIQANPQKASDKLLQSRCVPLVLQLWHNARNVHWILSKCSWSHGWDGNVQTAIAKFHKASVAGELQPLCFTNPSPISPCVGILHRQGVNGQSLWSGLIWQETFSNSTSKRCMASPTLLVHEGHTAKCKASPGLHLGCGAASKALECAICTAWSVISCHQVLTRAQYCVQDLELLTVCSRANAMLSMRHVKLHIAAQCVLTDSHG